MVEEISTQEVTNLRRRGSLWRGGIRVDGGHDEGPVSHISDNVERGRAGGVCAIRSSFRHALTPPEEPR